MAAGCSNVSFNCTCPSGRNRPEPEVLFAFILLRVQVCGLKARSMLLWQTLLAAWYRYRSTCWRLLQTPARERNATSSAHSRAGLQPSVWLSVLLVRGETPLPALLVSCLVLVLNHQLALMLLFWLSSQHGCRIKLAAQSQLAMSLPKHNAACI